MQLYNHVGPVKHKIWAELTQQLLQDTPKARFLAATMASSSKYMKSKRPQLGWVPCDPLVMAVAIDDNLIVDSNQHYVTVELHGNLTRAMTVIDWYGEAPERKNVILVEMLNLAVFAEMMKKSMLARTPVMEQFRRLSLPTQ